MKRKMKEYDELKQELKKKVIHMWSMLKFDKKRLLATSKMILQGQKLGEDCHNL